MSKLHQSDTELDDFVVFCQTTWGAAPQCNHGESHNIRLIGLEGNRCLLCSCAAIHDVHACVALHSIIVIRVYQCHGFGTCSSSFDSIADVLHDLLT